MIAVVVLVLSGWILTGEKAKDIRAIYAVQKIEPVEIVEKNSSLTEYVFEVDEDICENNSLSFLTIHQRVHVYEDEKLIYSSVEADSIYGHTTGTIKHLVELSNKARQVVVEVEPVFENNEQNDIKFYYGNPGSIIQEDIATSLWEIVVSLVIIGVGVSLIVYFFLLQGGANGTKETLYLGSFAVLLGVWAFGETMGSCVIISNRVMATYTAFTILSFLPILFVLFISEFLKIADKKVKNTVLFIMYVVAISVQMMQFLNIRDLKQNALLIQSMIVVAALYFIFAIVVCIRHGKYKRRAYINLVGAILLIFAMIVDLRSYYARSDEVNSVSTIAFMAYIILLSVETAKTSRSQHEQERKLEIYRQLATVDLLTNCKNRNAYLNDIAQLKNPKNKAVVVLDLNNLKECNDTKGHAAGDQYIINASELIRECFGKYGEVYRTGGDEFLVLFDNFQLEKIQKIVLNMEKIQKHRKLFRDNSSGIACGYACFDESVDKNIRDTIERADARMYENKKEIKEKIYD